MKDWKDIPGYEGYYQINKDGNIKRVKHKRNDRKQILKERTVKVYVPSNGGYPYISLCKNGVVKSKTIHRLIAETFIENPNDYPCINHIDGNKQNNSIDNLEWCTYSHNNSEAYRLGLTKGSSKETLQYDKEGNLIRVWKSTREAEKELNIANGKVSWCCTGKRKTAGGYIWKYTNIGG